MQAGKWNVTGRVVLTALIALAAAGLFRLKLDVEVLNLLPGNNQVSRGLLLYQKHFLNSGELIITLQSPSAEQTGRAVDAVVKALRPMTNLVKNVFWQPPWNDSIQASAQFLAYLWLNAPTQKVAQLAEGLQAANQPALLADTRERMTTSLNPADLMLLPRDPFQLSSIASTESQTFQTPERFFGSADGRFRMIYAYAAVPVENYDDCHRWVREMRAVLGQALAASDSSVKLQLTGRPVFVDEIASGMKSDMSTNAPGTLFMIGLLFYLVHREVRALLILLVTLLIVMVWTALVGAAFLGQLNVISIGFASILLGLAEDFGIVLHQELKSHPHLGAPEIRRLAGPGIFWSAVTTASAFALLNLSSLPGLRQLGTLVGLGIILGAWVMVYLFLPLLYRFRKNAPPPNDNNHATRSSTGQSGTAIPFGATVTVLAAAALLLVFRHPRMNPSPDVLRPRESEASRTLALVQQNLGLKIEPYWLVFRGESAAEVGRMLSAIQPSLETNLAAGRISAWNLPNEIWPEPAFQKANLPLLRGIAREKESLLHSALAEGFTTNGLELTTTVLDEWAALRPAEVHWPQGRIAEWLSPRFVSITGTNLMALGLIYPTAKFDPEKIVPHPWKESVLVSGWGLLGKQVFASVKREVPLISAAVLVIVTLALYLTFRNVRDVVLSFAVLCTSALVLLASMTLLGWSWNLINLTSLPLLLGMGIDYSIHIQLALARMDYDRRAVFQNVGRALLLAGSTSIIGFALLGTSSNLGMASLGRVCALGLTITLLVSVFLLPAWSAVFASRRPRK